MSFSHITAKKLVALLAPLLVSAATRKVTISVDASVTAGPLKPLNQFFGCDEPNYAYYPHGQELLADIGNLSSTQSYFRTHNLLTTGPGYPAIKFGSTNAYTEDAAGNPIYNWTIVDRIFDTYLAKNVKPYAQIGFMPEVMATNPDPYFFNFDPSNSYNVIFTGWTHVPKSYEKYAELVYQWVTHCVARYGAAEVNSWYWETWNEPNIGYWNGTMADFLKLNDYTIDAVLRALPAARVGGLELAGGAAGNYLSNYFAHAVNGTNYATGKTGQQVDFLSFHAKGVPLLIDAASNAVITTTTISALPSATATPTPSDSYTQMNISVQLSQLDDAFAVVASTPPFQNTPIILSELDPDGCAGCITPQYQQYRVNLLYGAYIAESFTRAMDLAARHKVNLEGMLTWAFEYEGAYGDWFDGFRVLAYGGINRPVMSAHKMLARVSGTRVQAVSDGKVSLDDILVDGVRGDSSVGVLAALGTRDTDVAKNNTNSSSPTTTPSLPVLRVFIWNYHDNNVNLTSPFISVALDNLPAIIARPRTNKVKISHYRLDNDHGNTYTTWLAMGSPHNPTDAQLATLKQASNLALLEPPTTVALNGQWSVWGWGWWQPQQGARSVMLDEFELPIRAMSLIEIEAA